MPVYPQNPTYVCGFYDNKNTNGVDDRVYSAKDMREPYKSIFSDGVKPNADGTLGNDLLVEAVSGMQIRVAAGRGLFGGAFFWNKSIYTITLDTASTTDRYDCIIIRADDTENVRNTTIYVKSLADVPTASNLIRTEDINEYCLGYVKVPALATSITQSNITDTRLNQNLCGVITGVFNQVDGAALNAKFEAAFNEWFDDIKDAFVAGATLIHTYTNSVVTTAENQTEVEIGIPQYNMNTDVLIVSVNGNVFSRGTQYEVVDNTKVRFTLAFPLTGTQILFQVLKSVDGSQAESVVSQVNDLINTTNDINKKLEHHYYCNGVNDNILLSRLTQEWINGGTDYSSMCVKVHGQFGATSPYTGAGTDASPYQWMSLGGGNTQSRKIVFDFTDCSQIEISCDAGTYNTIIYGLHVDIIGANVIATGGTQITMFSRVALTFVNAERCRFWITSETGYIARGGDFKNCRTSLTTSADNACCFNVMKGGLLRLYGGEHYAYAPLANFSTIIYVNAEQIGAVVNTYSISCPTNARSNLTQTFAINCLTSDACCSFTDTITTLSIAADGQNVRGTIPQNRLNMI